MGENVNKRRKEEGEMKIRKKIRNKKSGKVNSTMEKQRMGIKGSRNIMFWNVPGVFNKDKGFWKFIKDYGVVSLSETWVENKDKEQLINKLPKEFRLKVFQGSAKGGFLIGIKENRGKEIKTSKVGNGLICKEMENNKEK